MEGRHIKRKPPNVATPNWKDFTSKAPPSSRGCLLKASSNAMGLDGRTDIKMLCLVVTLTVTMVLHSAMALPSSPSQQDLVLISA